MKNCIVLSFFLVALLNSCSSSDDNEIEYSACVQESINSIQETPAQSPRASIEKYNYNGKEVFLVKTNFPDGQSQVFDSSCQAICQMGGIDGPEGDTCVNWDQAVLLETVWEDER